MRVERALVELRALLDLLAIFDQQTGAAREQVGVLFAAVVGDRDDAVLLRVLGRDDA